MSDVIVIGGGPAGSTVAALVAETGRQVRLFEREQFPRFAIGESLMPDTYWTFKRLGVLDRLKDSAFPRKHSVQFFGKSGRGSAPFYFSDTNPHESAVTWQVLRGPFDEMLLDNARAKGALKCIRVPGCSKCCSRETAQGACAPSSPMAKPAILPRASRRRCHRPECADRPQTQADQARARA